MVSNNIGLPLTKRVKLTYVEKVGLTCTSGVAAKHTFLLNSIFDPDYTGVGHQPYGRDQWATLYGKYMVTSAVVRVKWSNTATNNIPHTCGISLDKNTDFEPNLDYRIERQKGRCISTLLANSNAVTHNRCVFGAKSFFTLNDPEDSHQVSAPFSASPTLPAYCNIWIQPYDSVSSTSAPIYGEVQIDFNVLLSDPLDIAGS